MRGYTSSCGGGAELAAPSHVKRWAPGSGRCFGLGCVRRRGVAAAGKNEPLDEIEPCWAGFRSMTLRSNALHGDRLRLDVGTSPRSLTGGLDPIAVVRALDKRGWADTGEKHAQRALRRGSGSEAALCRCLEHSFG